jgi:polar amino acid transport system substrate-binding protein
MTRTRWRLVLVGLAAALVACGLPRDPEGTLARVRDGKLRVGATHSEPWVTVERPDAPPHGCEPSLVRALADQLSADVEWTIAGESELLDRLRRHELDLVIGGLVDDTPWKTRIGLTDDYVADHDGGHVLAVPPGENAWVVEIERSLRAWKADPSRWPEACP